MSNQIVITSGAKVRELEGVLTGTTGIVNALPINGSLGIPQLDVNGKILVSQLPNSVMEYLGTWNATTNTPYLVNGVGNAGDVYLVSVGGTHDFGAGSITFVVSDQVIYSGTIWQKASGTSGTVTSVGLSTNGNSLTIGNSPITTSGTITANFNGTNLQYVNGAGNLTTFPTLISSIGLSMPSAFSVSNSPLTANGTISVTGAGTVSQYIDGTGALQSFPSLTGYVPYVGATTDVDLGVHVLNAQALHVKGTAGAGHLGLKHQTATPTGSANESLVFANVDGDLGWQNGNLYSTILNTHSNTANRVYTFPNASGTLALTSDINYPVTSVFGRTGAVTAQSGDYTTTLVTEGTNLYYTDARARGALSFTAGSGAYNSTTGVITIPTNNNQITNGANYITLTSLSATTPLSYNNTTGAFSISQASTSTNGYLSSTDWNTFNNKQGAITLTTTGTSGAATFVGNTLNIPNYGSALSGYVPYTGATTDVNLGLFGITSNTVKAIGDNSTYGGVISIKQNNVIGGLIGVGYTELFGKTNKLGISFGVGSIAYFSNSILTAERTYTLPDSSGTLALSSDLSSYVPTSRTLTINGTAYDLSANRSWSVGTVTSVAALTIGTTGTDITSSVATGTTTPVITLNVPTASATNRGALSSADWTTFNNKQNALTNPVTGTGASGRLAYWNGTSTQTSDGNLTWDSTYTALSSPVHYALNSTKAAFNLSSNTDNVGKIQNVTSTSWSLAYGTADLSFPKGTSVLTWDTTNKVTFAGTLSNGTYTYTLPSATGTLALTSDLGSYLPLSGGTLTGGLYINPTNTATVGLDVASDTIRFRSDNLEGFKRQLEITMGSGTLVQMVAKGYGANYITDMAFYTATASGVNGSPAMYITSSNRIGILTGTPAYTLDVSGTGRFTGALTGAAATFSSSVTAGDFISTSGTGAILRLLGGGTSVQYQKWANDGGNYFIGISSSTGTGLLGGQNAYSFCLVTESARDMSFGTTNTERMRITSGGNLLVGTTTNDGAALQVLGNIETRGSASGFQFQNRPSTNYFIWYGYTNVLLYNTDVGNIAQIAYNTGVFTPLSDINKKKDFEDSTIGLNAILGLKPTLYRMKSDDESASKELGFIAQEVKEFIPQAYVENGENDEKFIGLNYNSIVAALVKAVQEQNQTIQSLQEQINALAK